MTAHRRDIADAANYARCNNATSVLRATVSEDAVVGGDDDGTVKQNAPAARRFAGSSTGT